MTRLSVDPALLSQAQEALSAPSKTETIRIALQEIVRKKRLADALSHRGRIDLDIDQEKLHQLREENQL